jgi:hypothetical protein
LHSGDFLAYIQVYSRIGVFLMTDARASLIKEIARLSVLLERKIRDFHFSPFRERYVRSPKENLVSEENSISDLVMAQSIQGS